MEDTAQLLDTQGFQLDAEHVSYSVYLIPGDLNL